MTHDPLTNCHLWFWVYVRNP